MAGGFDLAFSGGGAGEADGAPEILVERAFGQAFFVVSGHVRIFRQLPDD
jgi:hypothetical protein